jgi:glutaminyl-tRNA synthetase
MTGSQRKVKGTIHWVSIDQSVKTEVRLYDRLFLDEDPAGKKDGKDFKDFLNPDSLKLLKEVYIEPSIIGAKSLEKFQFERKGYFCLDPDSSSDNLTFNRTVTLRDTWTKKSNT